MIGEVPRGVNVPMVYKFGVGILEWNVKFLHYVDSIFIFADKFLSHNGAIFIFHADDLQTLKQI